MISPSPSAPLPWSASNATTVTMTAPTAVARIQNGPCDSSATGLRAGIETVPGNAPSGIRSRWSGAFRRPSGPVRARAKAPGRSLAPVGWTRSVRADQIRAAQRRQRSGVHLYGTDVGRLPTR